MTRRILPAQQRSEPLAEATVWKSRSATPSRSEGTPLQPEQPVACSLRQDDFADRRAEWARLGNEALREAHATSTGVRLVYSSTEGVEERLRELARLEAECCGFAEWKVVRRGTQLVLDVRAEGAGVAAVQALIGRS